ncbi:putative golgi SNAP receptor complex, subunit 1 [Helianthus anomalus]
MDQESGWEELRKEARKIEGDLDVKLSSYAKLGARVTQGGFADPDTPSMGSNRSWKSMEMEIQSLLEKLLDVNDSMSRCAASAAPTTSVTQKLARHRDILHEFSQVLTYTWFSFLSLCVMIHYIRIVLYVNGTYCVWYLNLLAC